MAGARLGSALAVFSGGVAELVVFDPRHSFASLLIHEGRPLMEIADQLGHWRRCSATTRT